MHSIILCFGVDVLSKLGRNMNNRIKSLENTKWILTLLICLYHIQFMGDEKYSTLFYWVKDLGNCVVQVFSLISGFLFFRNIRNLADVRDRAIKKYTALFIPFILWNIINTIRFHIIFNSMYTISSKLFCIISIHNRMI